MDFYYCKFFNLGPFRVNLSKSGLGYSVAGRGFRVCTTARGEKHTNFSIPRTGVGYRKSGAGCIILLPAVPVAITATFRQVAEDALEDVINENFKFYKKVSDDEEVYKEFFDRLFEWYLQTKVPKK